MEGSFEAKDPRMIEYLQLVKRTMSQFQEVNVIQIVRGLNRHVDSLATLASLSTEEVPSLIKVEVVKERSIDVRVNVSNVRVSMPC